MKLPARLLVFASLLLPQAICLSAPRLTPESLTGAGVIRELNLARQLPEQYASYLETLRGNFRGNIFILPSGALLRTREGVAAVDETIRFLRHARPLNPLAVSAGMARAATDHVADQANGGFGHTGSDRSDPATRLSRYGNWSGNWGENISYGKATARDIVAALLIDDGQRARKHRRNIFNPAFNFAGAAVGSNVRYRTVCSIEFSGGYAQRAFIPSASLLARNQ